MHNFVENYEEREKLYINNSRHSKEDINILFEEESRREIFMECMVECIDSYIADNVVIVDPFKLNDNTRIAFIVKDGIIFQLIEKW